MADELTFTPEQQEWINKKIGTTRTEARDKAVADAKTQTAKAKETTDQAALAAQNEWKTLSEQHQARVAELEPLEGQVAVYETLVEGMLKDTIKGLGDTAKTAVDGLPESMTAIEKLDWLKKNEKLFQVTGDGVGTPARKTKKQAGQTESEESYDLHDTPRI